MNDLSLNSLRTATEVEVVEAKESWSEYRLADGTVLRIKPVMIAISRVDEGRGTDDDPVYDMKSTLVTDVRVVRRAAAE